MTQPNAQGFDPTEIFSRFAMRAVNSATFDTHVINPTGSELRCVFFWGHDCYNCDRFKNTALMLEPQLKALDIEWYHANVYEDPALGQRFGLHGIPAFVFYRSGKRLGRISGWPGLPQFSQAVQRLHTQHAEEQSGTKS